MRWAVVGAVVVALAVVGVVALGSAGEPSQKDFAAAAREACEQRDLQMAKRTYSGSTRDRLAFERDLLRDFLADMRAIEPPEKARDEWVELQKLHAAAVRELDRGLKDLGPRATNASLETRVLTRTDPVYHEGPDLFEKAGADACARDSELLEETGLLRSAIDDACVQYLEAPGGRPTLDESTRSGAKRLIRRIRQRVQILDPAHFRPARTVPDAVAPIYDKHWVKRVRRMVDALDAAEGRIDQSAAPGPTARRVLRRASNFHDGILDSAFTLRLDKCLEVNADLGRRSQRFFRRVSAICRPAARRLAKAIDQQTIEGLRAGHREIKTSLRRLRRRAAPQTFEQAWKAALRSAGAVEREVGSISARAGTLTATEAEAAQRRLTALSKPARRRFAGLGLPDCARLF